MLRHLLWVLVISMAYTFPALTQVSKVVTASLFVVQFPNAFRTCFGMHVRIRIKGWWSLEFVNLPSEQVDFGWKRYTVFRESQSLSVLDNNRSTSLARGMFLCVASSSPF